MFSPGSLTIPGDVVCDVAPSGGAMRGGLPPMDKGTVLVVDDEPSIVTMLAGVLHAGGYHVVTAEGRNAVEVAQAHQPDVILLDLMMPTMPGMAVSERLRANPLTATIPIIVMSAQSNLTLFGQHVPVDDQLAKPFELDDLYATVARWVTQGRGP